MNLTVDEVNKMKVVELRAELIGRGLDTKGVKAVLVERLLAAVGHDGTGTSLVSSVGNGSSTAAEDAENNSAGDAAEDAEEIGSPKALVISAVDQVKVVSPVKVPAASPPPTITNPLKPVVQAGAAASPAKIVSAAVSPAKVIPAAVSPVKVIPAAVSPAKVIPAAVSPAKVLQVAVSPVKVVPSPAKPTPSPVNVAVKVPQASSPTKLPATGEVKPAGDKIAQSVPASQIKVVENNGSTTEEKSKEEPMETDAGGESVKRKLEDAAEDQKEVKKAKTESEPTPKIIVENEPEFDNNCVLLDWYKSDLNLKISTDTFLNAEPIVSDEFPFAYGGAKATYGFTSGKIFFEVKWVKSLDVRADFGDLESKHVLRVGWSDLLTDLQLGEEKFSYGFESKAKMYKGGEIVEHGEKLVEGDVVGAYLDIGSEHLELIFTKNGTALGEPLQVPKAEVEGKTWFPHVLVRNVKFEVNFGSTEPAHTPLEGFEFVGKVESTENRSRGPQRPEKRGDCELIMLVGLACSGKTKWAKEYVKNNAEKNYIILGTSTVVERSVKDPSVITSPKAPKAYEAFMNRAGKFVEKLVDMAPTRRRNYILDQSNVLPSVQRRKCGGFEGFRRRAVVVLPSDEEYQTRIKSKEQEQGKSVPKSTILDMKASFQLPEVGELFSEVEYPEVPKVDAEKLVSTYNKEGVDAGYGRSGSGKGGNQRSGAYYGRGRGNFPRGGGRGMMRGGPRGGRGGMMMRGPPRPPMRGMASMRPPMGGFRGRPGMGGPQPMSRGPPPPMNINTNSRYAHPSPTRGGMRGSAPGRGGPAPMRGSPGLMRGGPSSMRGGPGSMRGGMAPMRGGPPSSQRGGTWQRASGPMGNGQRAPQSRPQGRGGSNNFPRWSSPSAPKPLGNARPPQVWQQQPPPQQQQSVWGGGNNSRGYGNAFGGQQQQQQQQPQQQQQQFVDPWVQHQQVPDQGFGRSWDSMGSGNPGNNSNRGGGGSWQGYGGQSFGGFGRR